MRLTLRQLEIFSAIARAGNVSRAAERLAMSQSAASSALLELEQQFACPLFDRIGKTLHLNSSGAGLLPRAEVLLQQARDVERYLSGGLPGPLNLGATLTIGNYLAPLLIADYMQAFADAPVALQVANTQTVVERLLRFDCDLGLIEGEVSHPDLRSEIWLEDELVVFCAPGDPLGKQPLDLERLRTAPWIMREPGSGTRQLFDRVLGQSLAGLRVRLELAHTEAIKRAVESGLGIACLSRLSLREAFRRGSLLEIPTPGLDLRRNFYIVAHRQRPDSAAMRAFVGVCRRLAGGHADTAALPLPFIP